METVLASFLPFDVIRHLLSRSGFSPSISALLAHLALIVVVAALCVAANVLVRRVLLGSVRSIVARTETKLDDVFLESRVFERLAHVAPGLIIYASAGLALPGYPALQDFVHRLALAYLIVVAVGVISAFLNAVSAIYNRTSLATSRPIKSYVQVLKILLFMVGTILVISTLLETSPWVFLSGLGALTAVLLLVFKDSILGLVASVQLTSHDMVRIGDWVEMPKYGADGDVIDITLNVVKIRNWDKTITTIPTYALISESFKNWRGMKETGGRRIKRAINVDMSSIRFVTEDTLKRFRKMTLLREYLDEKLEEIRLWNASHGADLDDVVNGRRLTNVGTFRAYIVNYLRMHPKIRQDLTFLVRQLAPGPEGLPLEIYVFTNDTVWANYEGIQADIFDHLLAVLPEFGLRVFQAPTGQDVREATATLRSV